jgi:hypothetical protein
MRIATVFRIIGRLLNAAVILALCVGIVYLLMERWGWETEIYGAASMAGHMCAKDAYKRGEPRILELSEDEWYGFTGRVEDGFEVWTWHTYRGMCTAPQRASAEHFVEGWNSAMRILASKCLLPHSAIEKRIEELGSESSYDRFCAADALGWMGPEAKAAVPALANALKDQDILVRAAAAEALGKMGPAAKAAVPALNEALQDDSEAVRRYAEYALEQIGQ